MDASELEDYALNVTSEEEEDEDVEFEEENQDDASLDLGSQLSHFHQFDRVDYEALATEKRKRLSVSTCSGSGKKARLADMSGASKDEIEEAMNHTKIRGRKKRSKGKLSPQVTSLLGHATVLYAHGRYEEAIHVLLKVIKLAAHVPDSYHTLGLVLMALGDTETAMKWYEVAALLMPKDSPLWKILFAWHRQAGHINLKIAQCYLSLGDRVKAVKFFYKALHALEDSVDCRLDLTSLLIEDGKEDEAIALLLPPENSDSVDVISAQHKSWWLDGQIKLKLCYIYRAKGMLKDFVDTILPFIHDSLCAKPPSQKAKKRLTIGILRKRTKILDVRDGDEVFSGVRPLASRSDLMKALRAKRKLKKMGEVAKAAGINWDSDDLDNQSSEEEARDPPLPNFLKDEEHYKLILDLCKALQLLERYWEALELIDLIRRFAYKKLPVDIKEELQSLSAQMSYKTTDPKHGFECMRSIVVKHPYSVAAWNCYYKITSRLGKSYSKYGKFLRYMRNKHADCVPPILINGHHFSMGSYYQDAAREYLAAYKLQPESPLVNLCVGTSLVNLALGFRLQNKNQCLAQGFSFLYKNLLMAEDNKVSLQEALYNIARAYHHVGLITLAASYYEKVLQTYEKDCPIPKLLNENSDAPENLHPGYCDLRREAAYNLHLIYKKSGAIDLARQILKDHCTL